MAILFALVAMVATFIGGLAALRVRDRLHLVLGLAAGVLLGVAAFDLLPEALEQTPTTIFHVPGPMLAAIGGFFTVHILERTMSMAVTGSAGGAAPATASATAGDATATGHGEVHGHHHDLESVGLLAGGGLVLHSLLDGVGIGISYQAGAAVGLAVAIAVIAHDFADGFNTFTITSLYGNARRRALTMLALDALAPLVGAVIGTLVSIPTSAEGYYLGYFAGFLLYLATSDILPEAYARHPSRMTLVCTVAGAGLMWLVVGLSG